ncbi:hypothetical protein TL16_g11875 [Triparma laevis f. inornata]|uniref:Uncharacterized protein n=1 Tax=Triparma laevis f. inornata TaxID=1714386 RepID=A0A9W7BHZ7_9STRA|nr:hypothetical protein TL16_g11875 [Triparma laevis f. inornata]
MKSVLLLCFLATICQISSFAPRLTTPSITHSSSSRRLHSTALFAAKKRKRKTPVDESILANLTEEDAKIVKSLPDFILPDDLEDDSSSDSTTSVSPASSSPFDSPSASSRPIPSRSSTPSSLPTRDVTLESTFTFDTVPTPLPKPAALLKNKRKRVGREGDGDTRSFKERFKVEETVEEGETESRATVEATNVVNTNYVTTR